MSQRVMISGPLGGASVLLKSYLIETGNYDVDIVQSLRESIYDTISKNYILSIFCHDQLNADVVRALKQIRLNGCTIPFLIAIKKMTSSDADEIGHLASTNVLRFPVSPPGFIYIVESMVKHKRVHQRRHPRFYVEINASLTVNGVTWSGKLKNFSVLGAAIELQGGKDIQPGDKVEVKLVDSKRNLFNRLKGKVVWTLPFKENILKRVIGLELSTPLGRLETAA